MSKFTCLSAIVAIGCVSVGLARAEGATPVTRSQVTAQLDAARNSGELLAMSGEDSGSFWLSSQPQASGLARLPVRTETEAARRRSAEAVFHGEDSGSMHMAAAPFTSKLTRAEVIAEMQRARGRGELSAMVGEDSGSVQLSRESADRSVLYVGPNVGSGSEVANVKPARAS